MRGRRTLVVSLLALLVVMGGALWVWPRAHGGPAVASALEVGGALDGVRMNRHLAVLEDPTGTLTLEEVRTPAIAARFASEGEKIPAHGYTESAYWLRFEVHNTRAEVRAWMLEFAYPHTDELTLFVPTGPGTFQRRVAGDQLPHAARELPHRNFLFKLAEPPGATRTYYLRVTSAGSMLLPLIAWDEPSFLANQPRDLGALFFFYGICAAMLAYNLCAYAFVRRAELFAYMVHALATLLIELSLSGHTFQLLVPSHPRLSEELLLASYGVFTATSLYLSDVYLDLASGYPRISRLVRAFGHATWLIVPLPFVLPHRTMVGVLTYLLGFVLAPIGVVCIYLVRKRAPRVKMYMLIVAITVLGFAATILKVHALLPTNFWTDWSIHIGCSLQLVLLSSVMAALVRTMRTDVTMLNAELSRKVTALQGALGSAEEATARAEEAMRARDEFVATMSHELRTPLNAIINVPQGLLREFRSKEAATCGACGTVFELEAEDQTSPETPCPECGASALAPHVLLQYRGEPTRTTHFLTMIERSGRHLLRLVDTMLDANKLDAGRLTLAVERCDVPALVHEVVEEMSPLAQRFGVSLELVCAPEVGMLTADGVRLKQVLFNLIGNAIKFSDGRGPVTVRVRDVGDSYEFAVEDRGIGIAESDFGRLFSSFEQVHKGNTRKYGGTGLGLSISRSLVGMHGGEIWFRSQLGRGTTFFFLIPKSLGGDVVLADNDNGHPVEFDADALRS